MGDFHRSTTATTLDRLPEPLRGELRLAAKSALLTVPENAQAFLTESVRLRWPGWLARLFGADSEPRHVTAMVIGPRDVLLGTHGEQRGTLVFTVRLDTLEMSSLSDLLHASGPDSRQIGDDGITLSGFPVSSGAGKGSYFVGLGPPSDRTAQLAMRDAIRRAKRS